MGKVVWKTTPKAAYEWAEVEAGESMKDYERSAMLDDFVTEHGLVPVETTFEGEVPTHKYGRYKADAGSAQALAPAALPGRETDLTKANQENDRLKAENARLMAQLNKAPAKARADVIDPAPIEEIGTASVPTTEDAREALNQQEGVNLVGGSEEMRQDMSTVDRSDKNLRVDVDGKPKVRRGRPSKGD